MQQTKKNKIPCYSMKMQIYPSAKQKEKIEKIFRALHVAYNITFHEVFQKNPEVCTEPNDKGAIWPDYKKMATAAWRKHLIECNSMVAEAPAAALQTNNGLFLSDAKRAWDVGMHKLPVDEDLRKNFHFYNSSKPRTSFMVQTDSKNLIPSVDNEKVAFIKIPGIQGKIKARGFNRKVWFGKNGEHTYTQALKCGELAKQLTVRVTKDSCGSYYVSVTFSDGKAHDREIYLEMPVRNAAAEPIGIDVGIKDIAILSNETKIENKHFKKQEDRTLKKLNRQLSRRWGSANMAFRDYNRDIRTENRKNPQEQQKPLAVPSKRYIKTKQKKSIIERKIARRRNTYYDQQTFEIIKQSSKIAIESLHVKNMLRNHKLAYALGDAAMSDFLSKLKYKAERLNIDIIEIGSFEPSSQLCSVCGRRSNEVKNLSVRFWTCPNCGKQHDRDINAAKNILKIAQEGSYNKANSPPDSSLKENDTDEKKKTIKPKKKTVLDGFPQIEIVFSRELTKVNDPRYVIIDRETKKIIDDAQGTGFRSISNAKNCFLAKKKYSQTLIG